MIIHIYIITSCIFISLCLSSLTPHPPCPICCLSNCSSFKVSCSRAQLGGNLWPRLSCPPGSLSPFRYLMYTIPLRRNPSQRWPTLPFVWGSAGSNTCWLSEYCVGPTFSSNLLCVSKIIFNVLFHCSSFPWKARTHPSCRIWTPWEQSPLRGNLLSYNKPTHFSQFFHLDGDRLVGLLFQETMDATQGTQHSLKGRSKGQESIQISSFLESSFWC